MTGEITLGACRSADSTRKPSPRVVRDRTILLPKANEKDLSEVPEDVRADLTFVLVESMDQVLELALDRPAGPADDKTSRSEPEPPPQYAH
jgi:ATP-dependent Lon protease